MRPYVRAPAGRVILIYLPESLGDSFRKPVTSTYLRVSEPFPRTAICLQESNKSESVVVSFMVWMFAKCPMRDSSSSDHFNTFSLRARRCCEHNWCFSGMQLVSNCKCLTWQGVHVVWVCVCVFASTFPYASLSASCRVSCWPFSPPLTLSSDCFLSAVPDRK